MADSRLAFVVSDAAMSGRVDVTDRAPTEREPRTAAGRAMRLWLLRLRQQHGAPWPKLNVAADNILAIEEEAAASPPATETGGLPSDARAWEQLRIDSEWPTPNHMRHAADALDMLVYAKYGDILRWVADRCDGVARLRSPSVGEGSGEGET